MLVVEQQVHRRHWAGTEFVETFCQCGGRVDQALIKVGAIFTAGDAVERRADDASLVADLVAADAGGDGVFVEDVLPSVSQSLNFLLIVDFLVDRIYFLQGKVVVPRGALGLSPTAEEAVEREVAGLGALEDQFHFFPVAVALDGGSFAFVLEFVDVK